MARSNGIGFRPSPRVGMTHFLAVEATAVAHAQKSHSRAGGFSRFVGLALAAGMSAQTTFAQIVVESGGSAMDLAQAVLPEGITIHAAQLDGFTAPDGILRNFGTFAALSSGYGLMGTGIVLGSGDAMHAHLDPGACQVGLQPRFSDLLDNATPEQVELLDRALGVAPLYRWFDAAQLDVVISVPTAQRLILRVVFASEEYPEYGVCPPGLPAAFGDALGIFLEGPGGSRIYHTTMPGGAPFAVGSQAFCLTFPREVMVGCPGGFKPVSSPYTGSDQPDQSGSSRTLAPTPSARFAIDASPTPTHQATGESPSSSIDSGLVECFDMRSNCISGVLGGGENNGAVHVVPIELAAGVQYTLTFIIGDRQDYQRDSFALLAKGNLMPSCPADFNADGVVDDNDFVIFAADYELFAPRDSAYSDLNNDSFVDDGDFVQFAAAYSRFGCPR